MNQPITPERAAVLTDQERAQLTYWKAAYVLRADIGLTQAEAKRLAFIWYLRLTGRLDEMEALCV